MNWSRDVLLNFIKADSYKHAKLQPKLHNFDKTLPEHLLEQADEILKSTYNLEFQGITKPVKQIKELIADELRNGKINNK